MEFESGPSLVKLMIILNFAMLLSMTVAQKPVQKIVTAVTTNYKKKAIKKVCDTLYEEKDKYSDYIRNSYISGCMWQKREDFFSLVKTDKQKEKIQKIFDDQNSLEFDKLMDKCSTSASIYEYNTNSTDLIVSGLQMSLNCGE